LLLPGSRVGELKRHWPVMLAAARLIAREKVRFLAVLPDERIAGLARTAAVDSLSGIPFEIQAGGLAAALGQATVALASTGTVTMECAYFGVPTVTLYKTSWSTYEIGRRLVTVPWLTMPNLLAGEPVFPEFIQSRATAENLAGAALKLL